MEGRKIKIVVLDGYSLNPGDLSWEEIGKLGGLTVYDRTPKNEIKNRIENAEIVFTNKNLLTRETLANATQLKYIGVLATGYNVVDIKEAQELGMVVTNVPAYGTAAVAQMATDLLLEMCHHTWIHSEAVKTGEWANNPDWCFWKYPLVELAGKKMGIIGLGQIGQAFATIAQAIGMEILGYDEYPNKDLESEKLHYVSLEELLTEADVISLHCPLVPSTQRIINKDNIAKMKDGVLIINTSRGPLVEEKELAEALFSGKVGGAALDVLAVEPPAANNPLINAPNCIITPHISWAPK